MGLFVKVGTTEELEALEAGKVVVEAAEQRIAIFNLGGGKAIEDTCPHRGGQLSEGTLTEDEAPACARAEALGGISSGAYFCLRETDFRDAEALLIRLSHLARPKRGGGPDPRAREIVTRRSVRSRTTLRTAR